eukprot:1951931-Pyramimonas_sp.AAC.1
MGAPQNLHALTSGEMHELRCVCVSGVSICCRFRKTVLCPALKVRTVIHVTWGLACELATYNATSAF